MSDQQINRDVNIRIRVEEDLGARLGGTLDQLEQRLPGFGAALQKQIGEGGIALDQLVKAAERLERQLERTMAKQQAVQAVQSAALEARSGTPTVNRVEDYSPYPTFDSAANRYRDPASGRFTSAAAATDQSGYGPGRESSRASSQLFAQMEAGWQQVTRAEQQASAEQERLMMEMDRTEQSQERQIQQLTTRYEGLRAAITEAFGSQTPASMIRSLDAVESRLQRLQQASTAGLQRIGAPSVDAAGLERQFTQLERQMLQFRNSSVQADTSLNLLERRFQQMPPATEGTTHSLERLDGELKQKKTDAGEAEGALGKLWNKFVLFTEGTIVFKLVDTFTNALMDMGKQLITAPAQVETFTASYTRLFHDAAAAKKEMDQVIGEAPQYPQQIQDIVGLDQRLILLLGDTDKLSSQFGRSLKDVRDILLDTGAAVKTVDLSNLARDLRLLQDRPGDAIRSLERMGVVTREELAAQGIEFDKHGKNIYSTYEQTFNAVLNILNDKFGGMGRVQSTTFEGMVNNTKDFMFRTATFLGQDIFADIRMRLANILDSLDTTKHPEVAATLADWGDKLSRIWNVGMKAFDAIGQGVKDLLTVLKPATDLLGQLIGQLPKATEGNAAEMANFAQSAQYGADALDQQDQSTQEISDHQVELEKQLRDMGRAADDIRESYKGRVEHLKDEESALDRIYNKGRADRQIAELRLKIAQDMALAQDKASSQGRSAQERLPGEQRQLTDLMEEAAHTEAKNKLQDSITGLERERDAKLLTNKHDQDKVQDELADLRNQLTFNEKLKSSYADVDHSHKAMYENVKTRQAQWALDGHQFADKVDADSKQEGGAFLGLKGTALDAINSIRDSIESNTGLHKAVDGLKDSWDKLMETFNGTPGKTDPIMLKFQDLANELGLDTGLTRTLILLKYGFMSLFEMLAIEAPVVLNALGAQFEGLGHDLDVTGKGMDYMTTVLTNPGNDALQAQKLAALGQASASRDAWAKQSRGSLADDMAVAKGRMQDMMKSNFADMAKEFADAAQQSPYHTNPSVDAGGSYGGSGGGAVQGPTRPEGPQRPQRSVNPGPQMTHTEGYALPPEITFRLTDEQGNVWFQQKVKTNSRFIGQVVASQAIGAG